MKLVVCGGRAYSDRQFLFATLDVLHKAEPITEMISGGAMGADRLAEEWADLNNVPVRLFSPQWRVHGRAAGPIRNGQMVAAKPDYVLAFPGRKGTANMVAQARAAGIEVLEAGRL